MRGHGSNVRSWKAKTISCCFIIRPKLDLWVRHKAARVKPFGNLIHHIPPVCLMGDCEEIAIVTDSDGLILENFSNESDVDVSQIGDMDSTKVLRTGQNRFNEAPWEDILTPFLSNLWTVLSLMLVRIMAGLFTESFLHSPVPRPSGTDSAWSIGLRL